MPNGRPTRYSPALAERLCAALAAGRSLRAICAAPDMPGRSTIARWLADDAHSGFRERYAIAREWQADYLADELVEVADTAVDRETAAVAKVRVEARMWTAARLAPKRWGDRVQVAAVHAGGVSVELVAATA